MFIPTVVNMRNGRCEVTFSMVSPNSLNAFALFFPRLYKFLTTLFKTTLFKMMLFVIFAHKINCTSTKIASKLDALLLVYTIFVPKTSRLWQTILKHRLCFSYCLYGSKKHMMEQMFQDQSYPFYRFGDLFYLNKISEADWVTLFIQQTEDQSAYQMNFLHALVNGIHTGFTQSDILKTYRLGTAANITRLKKALIKKPRQPNSPQAP